MTGRADWSKVSMANGVGRNPIGSPIDPLDRQFRDSILDLVLCVRGATPNRHFGLADEVLSVGEEGLALDEIEEIMSEDGDLGAFCIAALARARVLLPKRDDEYV